MTESFKENFLLFSKPFLDALHETFETMVNAKVKPHSPNIKKGSQAKGDVTAMIGMNGLVESKEGEQPFKGLMAISWPMDTYLKVAGSMLMEEFTEYNDEIADAGSEIVNIIMGNAKGQLARQGFKIEMATPTTVKGTNHEIKYPPNTTVIEITVGCDFGNFHMELCYQDIVNGKG